MITVLTNEQKQTFTLAPTTAAGNPASVENPTWTVTAGDATVEVSEDGLSATIFSGAADVVSTVAVTADVDLGEGEQNITEEITVQVVAASANTLGVVAGEPELK